MQQANVPPDLVTHNTLINAYGRDKSQPLEKCLDILQAIKQEGLRPDNTTLNTLVRACLEKNRLDIAMEVAEGKNEHTGGVRVGVAPDILTFRYLLNACIEKQHLEHVLRVRYHSLLPTLNLVVLFANLMKWCSLR